MKKHELQTLERLRVSCSAEHSPVNLRGHIYSLHPFQPTIHYWSPSGPVEVQRTVAQHRKDIGPPEWPPGGAGAVWHPCPLGTVFGPAWSSHWLRVDTSGCNALGAGGGGDELVLVVDTGSEALVFDGSGEPVCGLLGTGGPAWTKGEDRRVWVELPPRDDGASNGAVLYIEVAVNGMFGCGRVGAEWGGHGPTPSEERTTSLLEARVFSRDKAGQALLHDLEVISGLANDLPAGSHQRAQALHFGNRLLNSFTLGDRASWASAHRTASDWFASRAPGPATPTVVMIGHAHIDTAWLWPYGETVRKCARSWASQCLLAERHSGFRFAVSQAQQLQWVKDAYPRLFERIRASVARGAISPVGGTWVEMDTNLPSGESLARQFLLGQGFFRSEFGVVCGEFWLPDTFGYAAQLPQIARLSGVTRFLTQKLSWNDTTKMPHNTFYWEGLDGSRLLTHFPPADDYNCTVSVAQLVHHAASDRDKGMFTHAAMLYGFGDGGGGPSEPMIQRISRLAECDPFRLRCATPEVLWRALEKDIAAGGLEPCTWSGELYFENHRGTLTSQAKVKEANRRLEGLLRATEMLWCMCVLVLDARVPYPHARLTASWKLLLLNQFHDVIPGSSVTAVYKEVHDIYGRVEAELSSLVGEAATALGLTVDGGGAQVLLSSCAFARRTAHAPPSSPSCSSMMQPCPPWALVVGGPEGGGYDVLCHHQQPQRDGDGGGAFAPPPAVGVRVELDAGSQVAILSLSNGVIEAQISPSGSLVSLELLLPGGRRRQAMMAPDRNRHRSLFELLEDIPNNYDAWNVDVFAAETARPVVASAARVVRDTGPLRAAIELEYSISPSSTMMVVVSLEAGSPCLTLECSVDWRESHKLLRLAVPVAVRSPRATFEVQHGHIERPTHSNTPADTAKFEVCAHRWCDLSEPGFGVAVINDSKYGHSVRGSLMCVSLLRSPKSPDPACDMGTHTFRLAIMPHGGDGPISGGVLQAAAGFNSPLLALGHVPAHQGFVRDLVARLSVPLAEAVAPSESSALFVLDVIKAAESGLSSEMVLRGYEASGGRGAVNLLLSPIIAEKLVSASRCNVLEEPVEGCGPVIIDGAKLLLAEVNPFEIVSVKLVLREN